MIESALCFQNGPESQQHIFDEIIASSSVSADMLVWSAACIHQLFAYARQSWQKMHSARRELLQRQLGTHSPGERLRWARRLRNRSELRQRSETQTWDVMPGTRLHSLHSPWPRASAYLSLTFPCKQFPELNASLGSPREICHSLDKHKHKSGALRSHFECQWSARRGC